MPLIARVEKVTNDLVLVIAVIGLPAYRRAE
ncbi:cobalt-precorrin-6A synthase [Roseobacter sp. CCS2]|nr:cobalt-precorrin-6A synthase [Roseobacter sp. CCS2]